jgi:lactoylglutathione lyase
MKLNHINLTVTDVQAAASFLETYFGLQSYGGNKGFMALGDEDGMVLTLMKGKRDVEVKYPETFHIGFGQASEADVTALYERMKADGFDVAPPERHHAWTFYVLAPGGFTVEILA